MPHHADLTQDGRRVGRGVLGRRPPFARTCAQADEAVCVGGARPSESYLRADRILEAARQTGAEAIHPGYGFLSENAEFAEACEAAGIVFIGPTPEQMRAFGLKHTRPRDRRRRTACRCCPARLLLASAEAARRSRGRASAIR